MSRYEQKVRKRYADLRWANWYWSRNKLPMYGPTRQFEKELRMMSWRRF